MHSKISCAVAGFAVWVYMTNSLWMFHIQRSVFLTSAKMNIIVKAAIIAATVGFQILPVFVGKIHLLQMFPWMMDFLLWSHNGSGKPKGTSPDGIPFAPHLPSAQPAAKKLEILDTFFPIFFLHLPLQREMIKTQC